MGLRMADETATRRWVRGEDEQWIKGDPDAGIGPHPDAKGDDAWVETRVQLSKRNDMVINDATVSERMLDDDGRISLKPAKQTGVDPQAFGLIVTAWSLGEPDVQVYEKLLAEDAEWIDACIRRAIDEARGISRVNSSSPGKADPPNDSPNSSDAEASQT